MYFVIVNRLISFFIGCSRLSGRLFLRIPHILLTRTAQFALIPVLAFGILSLVWAIPPQPVSHASQPEAKEYELKAVYLYNFLQFLQWPESKRPASRGNALVIGVVGESPFDDALDILENNVRQSSMQPVRFLYIETSADNGPDARVMAKCDLLFLASSEQHRFSSIIESLNYAPVLTVADTEGFLAQGGMINLVRSGGKIRWMINRQAVEQAGLKMSAQLLGLAIKVYNGR